MDDDKLARIHEWLGTPRTKCFLRGCPCSDNDPMPPPSDALEAQIRRKLNSEDCDVLFRFLNGWVVITSPFIRVHGPTIYDAALKYLRVANNG